MTDNPEDIFNTIRRNLAAVEDSLEETGEDVAPQASGFSLDEDRRTPQEETHSITHRCVQAILVIGTIIMCVFTAFLLFQLGVLIYHFIQLTIHPNQETEFVKNSIGVILGKIWEILSGSAFLLLFSQTLWSNIQKNLKKNDDT